LHYQGAALDSAAKQLLCNLIGGDIATHIDGLLCSSVRYTGITVREDIPGGIGSTFSFATGDVVGTAPTGENFPQGCALIRKYADNGSRPNLGWVYQGGLSMEYLSSAGGWSATMQTALLNLWNDMLVQDVSGVGALTMVIKSRTPTRPNTVAYNPVSRIQVASIPVTQRRRKPGVGS
jgi:hypothetical protein